MLDATGPFQAVLVVLVVLQVKHFICDYQLQTLYQLKNKGRYGHPGGIIHSGLHVVGTAAIFLVVTPTPWLGIAILTGEFLIHYHVDWAKDNWIRQRGYTPADGAFWRAIGFDQFLHQLTYIAIAGILVGTMLGTG